MSEGNAICEGLRSKFPSPTFELVDCPQFISDLLPLIGAYKQIILCYNVVSSCDKTAIRKYPPVFSRLSGSDLTGNPLEVTLQLEDTLLELSQLSCNTAPIDKGLYQSISSYLNLRVKGQVPVVMLCDEKDDLMTGDECRPALRVLSCCYSTEQSVVLGCCRYMGRTKLPDLQPLDTFLPLHYRLVYGKQCNGVKGRECGVEVMCRCFGSSVKDIFNKKEEWANVSLQMKWNDLTLKPHPDNLGITANLVVDLKVSGSGCKGLSGLWEELVLLHNYLDLLELQDRFSDDLPLPSSNLFFAKAGVLKEGIAAGTVDTEMRKLFSMQLHDQKFVANRQFLSLVELCDMFFNPTHSSSNLFQIVWYRLICCDVVGTVRQCFINILPQLKRAVHQQLHLTKICKESGSRLAQAVLLEQMVSLPLEFNPVELLVELGIEALLTSILHVFTLFDISPNLPSVPRFTEVTSKEEWLTTARKWLSSLAHVFSTLNVLSAATITLGNTEVLKCQELLRGCVSRTAEAVAPLSLPRLISSPGITVSVNLSTSLLTQLSISVLDDIQEWSLTLTSDLEHARVVSRVWASHHSKLPHIEQDDPVSTGDSTMNLNNDTTMMLNTTYDVTQVNNMTCDTTQTCNMSALNTSDPSYHLFHSTVTSTSTRLINFFL